MTTELDAVDEQLASIVSPIAKMREELIATRSYHREQIIIIDASLQKLNRVINAVEGTTKTAPKPKKRDTNSWVPSDVVMQAVLTTLSASEIPLSVADLVEQTGKSEASIHKAVQVLRSREIIRQAGVRPSPLRQGTNRKIYAMMPGSGINGSSAS